MQLTLIRTSIFLDRKLQVRVLFLKNVGRCHDPHIVLEALGQVFTQLQVQHHDLIDAHISI